MRITADIVLEQYAGQCGLVVPGEISTQLDIWNTVILEAVLESQALASHLEPYDMYLYAMVKSINGKKLTVCNGKQNYQVNGNMAGFIDRTAGYLYIRPQDTYNQVIRYWDLLDQTLRPSDGERMGILLELLDEVTTRVPVWRMGCDISREAAVMAYRAMSGE